MFLLLSVTEIMDSTSNNPGEIAMNTDSKDIYTDNTEGNYAPTEIKISDNLPPEKCSGVETQLQCIELNSSELSLTCGQSEIPASVIPEPPSSPILLPLSDDDQELTPPVGLDHDDDDDDDELKVIITDAEVTTLGIDNLWLMSRNACTVTRCSFDKCHKVFC